MVAKLLACLLGFIALTKADVPFTELNFADNALEPHIDNMTMFLHHDAHYAGQVRGVNSALEECGLNINSYSSLGALVLPLIGTDEVPSQCPDIWPTLANRVRNSGGGAYNHNLFWSILTPASSSSVSDISEKFLMDIEKTWGSFPAFQGNFTSAALSIFGSGWAWLIMDLDGLQIVTTANQDNPLMSLPTLECTDVPPGPMFGCDQQKGFGKCWDSFMVPAGNCLKTCGACASNRNVIPLLNLDMWEHAHYLLYNNRRADYVDNFWSVVNWAEVDRLYLQSARK